MYINIYLNLQVFGKKHMNYNDIYLIKLLKVSIYVIIADLPEKVRIINIYTINLYNII